MFQDPDPDLVEEWSSLRADVRDLKAEIEWIREELRDTAWDVHRDYAYCVSCGEKVPKHESDCAWQIYLAGGKPWEGGK